MEVLLSALASLRETVLILSFALALASCGYHFAGNAISLPDDVQSIYVGEIKNDSNLPGLEKKFTFALQNAITRWGKLRVAENRSDADAALSGTIRSVDLRPVSFDENDLVLQYETTVSADLKLQRVDDGKLLWEIRGLRQSDEYAAEAQVIVTSSSQFQQGTLDAVNLPQFTQVQLAESQGRESMDRLLRDIARDAYSLMTEGF